MPNPTPAELLINDTVNLVLENKTLPAKAPTSPHSVTDISKKHGNKWQQMGYTVGRNKRKIFFTLSGPAVGVGMAAATAAIVGISLTGVGAAAAVGGAAAGYLARKAWRNARASYSHRYGVKPFESGERGPDVLNRVRFWLQKKKLSVIADDTRTVMECWQTFQRYSTINSCEDAIRATEAIFRAKMLTDSTLSPDFILFKSFYNWNIEALRKFTLDAQTGLTPDRVLSALVRAKQKIEGKEHGSCTTLKIGTCYSGRFMDMMNDAMNRAVRGNVTSHLSRNDDMRAHVKAFIQAYGLPVSGADMRYNVSYGAKTGGAAGGALGGSTVGGGLGVGTQAAGTALGVLPGTVAQNALNGTIGGGMSAAGGLVMGVARGLVEAKNLQNELDAYYRESRANLSRQDTEKLIVALRTILKDGGFFEKIIDKMIKLHAIREEFNRLVAGNFATCSLAYELAVCVFRADKHYRDVSQMLPFLGDFVAIASGIESLSSDKEFESLWTFHQGNVEQWMGRHSSKACRGWCYSGETLD